MLLFEVFSEKGTFFFFFLVVLDNVTIRGAGKKLNCLSRDKSVSCITSN